MKLLLNSIPYLTKIDGRRVDLLQHLVIYQNPIDSSAADLLIVEVILYQDIRILLSHAHWHRRSAP